MRRSSFARARKRTVPPIPSLHPSACPSHRSADLAGRSVRFSPDIPVIFDRSLVAHHKLVGTQNHGRSIETLALVAEAAQSQSAGDPHRLR